MPATVFVATGALDAGREFWWDELEQLILEPAELRSRLRLAIADRAFDWQRGRNQVMNGGSKDHERAALHHALWHFLLPLPAAQREAAELLKNADLALYRAKSLGRFRFSLFEPAMDAEVQARKLLELELRRSIAREELVLEYQPQLDLTSGRFVGVEALVRWRHPKRGLVLPGEFIPVAEASGLIRALGEWVLHQACRQGEARNKKGCSLTVAVNLSPAQLKHNHLGPMVGDALTQTGLEPSDLEFEITEGVLIEKLEQGEDSCLLDLTAQGVRLAIDDFGIGNSSLSYLKQLPVAKIKIDRSFVRDIGTKSDADALVRAMVVLGHNLGKHVVAEGVETERQLALLRQFGCDCAQGFLLARPQSAERIQSLVTG